ncbi:MAG: ribonuclease PH [Firmicutes bacterium]|jgi:ribonuclease PH|nr:ribonuclease PH [Bacillota bacterium]
MARAQARANTSLRNIEIIRDFVENPLASVLISMGNTKVLCTCSVQKDVPRWMKGTGRGWLSAEYSMLPGASQERINREAVGGKQSGRTQEIQRLIGRSLRAVTDLDALGETQIIVDCDVLQADGGTRTAAITGSYVALYDLCTRLVMGGKLTSHPLKTALAAVSIGIVDGEILLDLDYSEDSKAEVDLNVVMTGEEAFVELQGTAEGKTFAKKELDEMLDIATSGIQQLIGIQAESLLIPPKPKELGFLRE